VPDRGIRVRERLGLARTPLRGRDSAAIVVATIVRSRWACSPPAEWLTSWVRPPRIR
jgi:hypothetical protein